MSIQTWTVIGVVAGVVAAAAAVIALVWQVRSHWRSGPRVSVESTAAIPVYGPPHAPEFRDDQQVIISVTNRGGAPVTVTNYGVRMGSKAGHLFVVHRPRWATPLPAPVIPGGVPVQVLVPVTQLRQAHGELGIPYSEMRPWVDLGDRRRAYSRNAVPLA